MATVLFSLGFWAVGDTEFAATEDGFDDVFAVMDLLSGGPVPHGGFVGVERMVLIIAEMGEFWLRLWVKLRNRVFSEILGCDWVLSQKPGFLRVWVRWISAYIKPGDPP